LKKAIKLEALDYIGIKQEQRQHNQHYYTNTNTNTIASQPSESRNCKGFLPHPFRGCSPEPNRLVIGKGPDRLLTHDPAKAIAGSG